jgi:hypothetical protein
MNSKIKYILICIIIIGGILLYRFLTYPLNISSDQFIHVYKPGDAAMPENYDAQCQEEFNKNLTFPLGEVDYAILCCGYFSIDKILEKDKAKWILEILNDTSSYVWGEVGTFLSDKAIIYYDKNKKPIGITELEEEGGSQTYSYPYLRRTKWGALTEKAFKEINLLLEN